MVFITATPSEGTVFDRTRSLFLSQSCVNGQACLSLSSPPVSSAPATASTGSLTRAGGNLWQSAGVWGITLFEFRRDLVEGGYRRVLTVFPTSADIWLGLVGIDDPAATFDIRIDVVETTFFAPETVLATGLRRCVLGLTENAAIEHVTLQTLVPYVGGGALANPATINNT
jgi:hypothetical protein